MKREALRIACFFACLLALQSWGQIITERPPIYEPKPEDFRIVDGKLYSTLISTNTSTNFIYPALDLGDSPATYGDYTIEVEKITPQGVVFRLKFKSYGNSHVHVRRFLLKHVPNEKELITGQPAVFSYRAMRVPPVTIGEETFAAYDCGLPNTPENRKTLTNSVAPPKP